MIETVDHLRRADIPAPICIGVHGIFAEGVYRDLREADPRAVVTTDTIPHPTNAISVAPSLAPAVRRLLE
jgi:ribose-phosphate pyrophosphokinase